MDINFTEFAKVMYYLVENNIPCELKSGFGGYLCFVPSMEEKEFDFICHQYSYGHQKGLLEIMGAIMTERESKLDGVIGWLTADNVIERIKKYQERKSGE